MKAWKRRLKPLGRTEVSDFLLTGSLENKEPVAYFQVDKPSQQAVLARLFLTCSTHFSN
jgi:hypothetical protein